MQFVDVQKQFRDIQPDIERTIKKVFASGQFVLGDTVAHFEESIARYVGTKYAVGLGSGTDALFLSLRALGVGMGDEVITSPFTMMASAEVIVRAGATPVFADINPHTFNIDPVEVKKNITKKTKAIIPVHLYGQSADMTEIIRLARKHKLHVVEDACQSLGARWKKTPVASIGTTGCLSFFPSKNLGGYGDGGMLVTNKKSIAEKVKVLRAHGAKRKYHHTVFGVNSRLDSLQAAMLEVKLRYLDTWNGIRNQKAQVYDTSLSNIDGLVLPVQLEDAYHVYHQYTVRTKKQVMLKKYLAEKNIPTMHYYPIPLHLQPVFEYLGYATGDLPEAEKAAREVLSLKIDPYMTVREQKKIITHIQEFYAA